jgi:hypothetical protein
MLIPHVLLLHFLSAVLCTTGYCLLTTKHKRLGFLLGGMGSVGWLMAAPSIFFAAQSLVFLVGSVIGYERTRKFPALTNR